MNAAIVNALQDKEIVDRFMAMGYTPAPSTPEQLAELIRVDTRKNAELVKRTGAKLDW